MSHINSSAFVKKAYTLPSPGLPESMAPPPPRHYWAVDPRHWLYEKPQQAAGQYAQDYAHKLQAAPGADKEMFAKSMMSADQQHMYDQAKGLSGFMQHPIDNTMSGLGSAFNWAGQHKGLLGGIAAGGVGLWGLHKLFGGRRSIQPPHPTGAYNNMHAGYTPGFAPQAVEKQGNDGGGKGKMFGNMLMPSLGLPNMAASYLSSSPQSQVMDQSPEMPDMPQLPYKPMLHSSDPRLRRVIQHPKMQQYIANLVSQTNALNKTTAI